MEAFPVLWQTLYGFFVGLRKITYGLPAYDLLYQPEGKSRALTIYTVKLKCGVHQIQKAFYYAHAKPGTLYVTVAFLVQTVKGTKQLFLILLTDTDPRIGDHESEHGLIIGLFASFKIKLKSDGALLGILHRICKDIGGHLLDADLVTIEHMRRVFIYIHHQIYILFTQPLSGGIDQVI